MNNKTIQTVLAIALILLLVYACENSPEFQTEPVKIETGVVRTICGPCFAFTDLEYIKCGKRIGRYEIIYADGLCRRKKYDYGGWN